ncbi:glycosyltransferase [Luteimonas sp. e5]
MNTSPLRVLHFVTGGFSGGATQVAVALVEAGLDSGGRLEPLLALRRKRHTPPQRVEALRARGIPLRMTPGWSHLATVLALWRLCRRWRPHVLVAHGFSEHLWGRYAGLLAGVPVLIHVEHNTRERYTRWRRAQSRWLARRSAAIVGCSEGVRQVLLQMGMPAERTLAIPNGIRLEPFAAADAHPWRQRAPGIVMVARLSRQKDHTSLLQALALLAERGLHPPLLLAGGGKERLRSQLEQQAAALGIAGQVRFLGVVGNVPELLMTHRIGVLSTHYEGMPLSLIEAMAAGCAVVASDAPGVREVIADGEDGLLVRAADPAALADALERLLRDEALGERLGAAARRRALADYGRERMHRDYEALFLRLAHEHGVPRGD